VRAKPSSTYLRLPKDLKTSDLTARHDRGPTSIWPAGSRKGKKGGEPFWLVSHSQISLSTSSLIAHLRSGAREVDRLIPLVRDRRSAYRPGLRTPIRVTRPAAP
jgi:hypothetical protein